MLTPVSETLPPADMQPFSDDAYADRRNHQRQTVFHRVHLYPVEDMAAVAMQNLSGHGAMAETALTLFELQTIHVSFDGHRFQKGQVRWIAGQRFGLSCDQPIAFPPGTQQREQPEERGETLRRELRVPVEFDATLAVAGPVLGGLVRNISLGGALVETAHRRSEGAAMLFQLPGRKALLSRVQWADGRWMGLRFSDQAPADAILARK